MQHPMEIKMKDKKYYEEEADESEFVQWYQTQEHPLYERPAVTIDLVLFTPNLQKILLIQRLKNPSRMTWALPGGFIDAHESSDEAAIREANEETGLVLTPTEIQQFHTFTSPGRDPRGWTISIAYVANLLHEPTLIAGDDAIHAKWFPIEEINGNLKIGEKLLLSLEEEKNIGSESLAFDHAEIVSKAYKYIKNEKHAI
jgi:ADP-ribose pyrophosphatase YjhB (NUDIX family)